MYHPSAPAMMVALLVGSRIIGPIEGQRWAEMGRDKGAIAAQ